jgi:hypothetical protein
MPEKNLIGQAEKARVREHHLRPDLKLRTTSEIERFIHDKQIVSILGGNELPSLISAILGREWKPSGKGFTSWNEWWPMKISNKPLPEVLRQIERSRDILSNRIFRKTKTFVSKDLWPILDPLIRHYLDEAKSHRMFTELEWHILKLLEKGSVRTDHLRKQLQLEDRKHTKHYHRSLTLLESYGLIAGYEDPKPEKHLHANIWQLWTDRVHMKSKRYSYDEALAEVLSRTIDACVIVHKDDISQWFQWETRLSEAMTRPFENGNVKVIGDYLISTKFL